jgi:hypothetical protein
MTLSRRDLLALAVSAAAASAAVRNSDALAAGKPTAAPPATDRPNKTVGSEEAEHVWNALPGAGHREFPLNDPSITEIFGYTEWLSYAPGESIKLFTHTTANTYDIEVVRDGLKPLKVWSTTGQRGIRQQTPDNAYAVGCRWVDPVVIPTAASWPSGFYLIILRTRDQAGGILEREAGFILRAPNGQRTQRLALIWTSATVTAYNDWGGANSYRTVTNGVSRSILAPRLSLQRPWARGLLRLPKDAPRIADVPDLPPFAAPQYPFVEWALKNGYSRHYSDAGWAYYERPFVLWAEQNGYQFDYVSQHDLQLRPDSLKGYQGAVIVGHDEYWSWDMRDSIESFIRDGGRVARFGANYIWQTRIEDGGRTQVSYKATPDPISATNPRRTTTSWDSKMVNRPAASTFGLSGLGGVYVRFGGTTPRASGGYTVYRPGHWVFRGTDARYGDLFGSAPSRIAAFEVDGVDYTFRGGLPYPTHVDGAPQSLEILAMAPAVRFESALPPGSPVMAPRSDAPTKEHWPLFYPIENIEYGSAMMAVMTAGKGEVFNSGCCGWMEGLRRGDFVVQQITKNVLDRFAAST